MTFLLLNNIGEALCFTWDFTWAIWSGLEIQISQTIKFLIESLDAARRVRWKETTANLGYISLIPAGNAGDWSVVWTQPNDYTSSVQTVCHSKCCCQSPSQGCQGSRVREHERQVRNEWRQLCSRKLTGQFPWSISGGKTRCGSKEHEVRHCNRFWQ